MASLPPADEAGAPPNPWRRRARTAYVAALVVAAAGVLYTQRERVADLADGARPLPLVAALGLGLVSLVQIAWFWSTGLRRLGAPLSMGQTLEATVAAIPARYVPGSIWYSAGRITHLRRAGAPTVTLSVVALLEMLLSFMVAVGLGLSIVAVTGVEGTGLRVVTLVGVAAIVGVVGSPAVVNPLVRWVARRRRIPDVPALRWRTHLELCGQLVLFWLSSATAFVLYLAAFPMVDAPTVARTAGTFLLGWAAGFIAVFAPQGAGVFETTVASTLDGAPFGALAVIVGGYRALAAVRDVMALAALAALRTRSGRGDLPENDSGPSIHDQTRDERPRARVQRVGRPGRIRARC